MKIVLVRHGEAEPRGSSDAARALTARGHEQALAAGAWLRAALADAGTARLLASPYRRAQETAQAIGAGLKLPVTTVDAITPDVDPRVALAAIEEAAAGASTLLVVSHMPLVAGLAAWMESGSLTGGRGFALAEVRVLELEVLAPGLATLVDLHVPGLA